MAHQHCCTASVLSTCHPRHPDTEDARAEGAHNHVVDVLGVLHSRQNNGLIRLGHGELCNGLAEGLPCTLTLSANSLIMELPCRVAAYSADDYGPARGLSLQAEAHEGLQILEERPRGMATCLSWLFLMVHSHT